MTKLRVSTALYGFMLLLFLGIFVPPVAMHFNLPQIAEPLYFFYGFLCHQLPQRSFFLFSPQVSYSETELYLFGYSSTWILSPAERIIGDPMIGYKLAVCARDTGLYLGILLGGLAVLAVKDPFKKYGLKQNNGVAYVTGWRLAAAALLALPMVIDGVTQLIATIINMADPFYMSTNPLRIVTGLGFGFVIGMWAFSTLRFNEKTPFQGKEMSPSLVPFRTSENQ